MGEAKVLRLGAVAKSEQKSGESEWVRLSCGAQVLVHPLRERQQQQKFAKERERVRRFYSIGKRDELNATQEFEATVASYFGTYVSDWKDILGEDDHGNEAPVGFTEENFKRVALGDPNVENSCGVPDFFIDIAKFINRRIAEHKERVESNAGNS